MHSSNALQSPAEDVGIDLPAILELSGAGYLEDGKWRVRGVDMAIHPGEIVTIIGPNGSGKSTTAKLALGLLDASEGRVYRGKKVRTGYVPQRLGVDWTFPISVGNFVKLAGRLSRREIAEALERTGVAHLVDEPLQSLSGGELQRVLLARAMARKPDLLVLDEPTQGVDFTGESQLYALITRFRDETGCAVLMISHDLHIVMGSTDRVLCLNGHVCCSGTPKLVSESPAYRSLFGPQIGETIAVYEHDHDHVHLPDGRVRHSDGTISDDCIPNEPHGDPTDHEGH